MEAKRSILRFIKRARLLGFPMDETAALLGLWQDRSRARSDVRRIASDHIQELGSMISELQDMVNTLKHLVHSCSDDQRPNCRS